jgi:hypothetical protein
MRVRQVHTELEFTALRRDGRFRFAAEAVP